MAGTLLHYGLEFAQVFVNGPKDTARWERLKMIEAALLRDQEEEIKRGKTNKAAEFFFRQLQTLREDLQHCSQPEKRGEIDHRIREYQEKGYYEKKPPLKKFWNLQSRVIERRK